jgi:F-type H+-transporting ATPase subunit gamma
MATLREIRQRIKGIKSTQQITRAMKMVASAKMRRAQERAFSARPYANKIEELVHQLVANIENPQSPLIQERPIQSILLVVITADRGLCGAFNSHIIKRTLTEFTQNKGQEVSLLMIGKKGYDFFRKRDYTIARHYVNIFSDLQLSNAEEISRFLMEEYISGGKDAVRIIFNEFRSVVQQRLVVQDLLPFKAPVEEEGTMPMPHSIDYLHEPSMEALLEALLPRYIKVQVWRALLESYASEQAARMTAMENATDNASELIQNLTLEFNKARQASITKEILEIVGGAEALRSAR